ncbi:MAG: dTDP-4-amino-4,6-dideoxygalactose transaminase [Steroidobacteraceae bacterium]|nr:dTDP-4-amino-4,6-dideoxygalactose transaminase [Steroidobacteraceae bacterium]
MTPKVPFNRPCTVGADAAYVREAIASGHMCGDGPFGKRAQALLEAKFAARHALLTTSCTAALEMSALLCGLEAGDEVIMPSYTFVSTANAVALRGARCVFVDIRPDTLNLDEAQIEAAITTRTRSIWPVHYAGIACEMDTIMEIARRRGLTVVEDAAQGVFATYKGRALGTLGDLGCYSFHETKNISCGEGGALLVNNDSFAKRAEILREKGTNRSQFLRGQVDKYTWVDLGSSYVPSDILAAYLLGQLEAGERITARRGELSATYARLLAPLAERELLRLPVVPAECASNHHMFYVLVEGAARRGALMEHLRGAGYMATFHYVPLHTSPVGAALGWREGSLRVTEDLSARLLRLPLYYDMSDADVVSVVREVFVFYGVDCRGLAA